MKPVMLEKDRIDYIDQSVMINFIKENSDMEWNDVCDFANHNIFFQERNSLYEKSALYDKNAEKKFESEQLKWMRGFFEAHPFLKEVMFVFDD